MTRQAASAAILAGAVALAVGVALLLVRSDFPRGDAVLERDEQDGSAPSLAAARLDSTVARANGLVAADQAAETAGETADVSPAADGETSRDGPAVEFPTLEVRVLSAGGQPVATARVYALPARGPGTDDGDAVPGAFTGADGTARLLLPAVGTYDVGAIEERHGNALALDVRVPGDGDRVDVRFGRLDEIDVSLSAEAAVRLPGGAPIRCVFERTTKPARRECPGRGEIWRDEWSGASREQRFRVAVDPSAEYEVQVHADVPLRAVPSRVRAGGSVELFPAGYFVRPKPSLVPVDRTFPEDRFVRIAFALDGGEQRTWEIRLAAKTPVEKTFVYALPLRSDRPDGVLRWSGPGVTAGSVPFSIRSGGAFDAPIRVEVVDPPRAPSFPLQTTPEQPTTPMQVLLPPGVRGDVVDVRWVERTVGDSRTDVRSANVSDDGVVDLGAGARSVVAFHGLDDERGADLVSRPTDVARAGTIRLLRGGFAVAVPWMDLPEALSLRIARSDGAPFAFRKTSTETAGGFAHETGGGVTVSVGMIIGPLEPGRVRFAMRLSGVDGGEVEVDVRPAEYSPLVLRPSPGHGGR